ncbi:LOW QUALITY PROTEIN: mediator of DNA damage checkpoint protein 1 [Harpia harpyja]|uniref:LOW QUALITY PROTEIN: mediator of DNA damage checkpoint protein 1 n=1 Tax=Harpia harpyja TaxID=202280 RepID=UPI0022B1E895|nr:LOW QUALITY PROTEIN: mediator of DNA damage checkpoint protein 1 [Harpia harpyja]
MWPHLAQIQMSENPKKHRFGPQNTPDPDVGKKMAIPNVQPQNHSVNTKMLVNPDVKHLKGSNLTLDIESNTGVKVPPKTGLFNPNRHRPTTKVSSNPDVEERGPDPDVGCPESHRTAPGDPNVKTETTDQDVEGQRTLLVESDTDVEEDISNPAVELPKTHRATQNVPRNPHLEMESPNPHAEGPRNKHWTIVVDSDTDVENEVNPDVGHPKVHRIVCRDPDVEGETPNPSVKEPPKKYWSLEVDSDTDIEEDWSQAALRPKSHKTPQNTRKDPTVVMETPNPDVGGLSRGSVASNGDSDTDVEDLDALPKVGAPKARGTTPEVMDTAAKMAAAPRYVAVTSLNPDVSPPASPRESSDTDVEMLPPTPDVRGPPEPNQKFSAPKCPRLTPNLSDAADTDGGPRSAGATGAVVTESDTEGWSPDPGPCLVSDSEDDKLPWREFARTAGWGNALLSLGLLKHKGVVMALPWETLAHPESCWRGRRRPQDRDVEGRRTVLVESDTDVEEDISSPGVEPPKTHRATQNVPRNPHLEMESRNPHAEGRRNKHWTIVVDSDTDVEENEVNPDVGHPKVHRIVCRDPDVEGETPNPSVKEPPKKYWSLEVDSDTDIEEDWSQAALRPKSTKHPQNTRKDPTVVMETPNPDVGGLSRGSVASNGDSDTDVEDLDALPKVGAPKARGTTPEVMDTAAKMAAAPDVDPEGRPRTNADPDVKVSFPNPDAGALKAECPLLDVGSDTDVEDNGVIPDVGTVQGCQGASGDPDVAVTSPNPDVSPPASPRESSDTDVEMLPPHSRCSGPPEPNQVPKSPPSRRCGPHHRPRHRCEGDGPKTPEIVPKKAGFPPQICLTPNLSDAADTDGGPRSAGATGAVVTESDTEGKRGPLPDPWVPSRTPGSLLKALPPPPQKTPMSSWSPPRASCHRQLRAQPWVGTPSSPPNPSAPPRRKKRRRKKKKKKKNSPPGNPPRNPRLPGCRRPRRGRGPQRPPARTWGRGPRRSQRLARSRGGGASGEGGASRVRGGAPPVTAPVRRSPRLQARPPPLEPPAMKGRGQVEPRPPAKPRPCRAGPGPSERQAQEKEKELPEVTGPQLRPRGGPASVPPKVLFTGVAASPEMEVALRTLGGSMATSVFDCTHLVTDRVRRTVKFLCAVARGVPIVTPEWLHKSTLSGHVLVPDPFLVCDGQQERHFGFSLADALRRARHHPLLQGYEVHVTPSVHPEPELMRDIVTCSGGTFLPAMPHTYRPRRLVISCEADKGCWAPALGARLPLVSAELLLTGLLRQRLQLQPFLLLPATPPPFSRDPPKSPQGFYSPSGGP